MAPDVDLDLVFCSTAKKFNLEKLQLKAVCMVESSLNPRAYRYENEFWEKYLKNNPIWKDRDPKEVSASYGLTQVLFTTAVGLGFPINGTGEELYDPTINVQLGAKLLRQLLDKNYGWWDISLAQYNGGSWKNPDVDGSLRNQSYVNRVRLAYWKLRQTEENCD